jgi:hypothetical protein
VRLPHDFVQGVAHTHAPYPVPALLHVCDPAGPLGHAHAMLWPAVHAGLAGLVVTVHPFAAPSVTITRTAARTIAVLFMEPPDIAGPSLGVGSIERKPEGAYFTHP